MAIKYNSNYHETIPFSDVAAQIHCIANTQQSFTVPGNSETSYQAFFEYNDLSNVFVRLNAAPLIPAANNIGTESYNEYKPEKRYVKGGDVIYFITPDTNAYCGVTLRQIPG